MDKDTLIAKRDALQEEFDEHTKIKADSEAEQLRLQGEHRVLTELIEEIEKAEAVEKTKKGK